MPISTRRRIALVDLVRGVERQQPARLDLGGRVEDQFCIICLSASGDPNATRSSGALAHQVERPLRLPEPAHAVEDPPGPEALLRDQEALAARAEEVAGRHAHVA